MIRTYIFLTSVFFLSGCATVLSASTQTIHIKAVDSSNNEVLKNVACIVQDPSGASHRMTSNPGTVAISRGSGELTINCSKSGYTQINTAAGSGFNAVSVVNVLFLPGFIIDAASGAYKKYPSHYVINMKK